MQVVVADVKLGSSGLVGLHRWWLVNLHRVHLSMALHRVVPQ